MTIFIIAKASNLVEVFLLLSNKQLNVIFYSSGTTLLALPFFSVRLFLLFFLAFLPLIFLVLCLYSV